MNCEATGNNYFTYPDRRPPKSEDKGEINKILSENIPLSFVHTADICGAKIQLRTNSKHVSEWWQLNWHIIDSKPDGIVYVVNGVKDYEPHLFYNIKERKILVVNSEYYGVAKSNGALGLAGMILEERGKFPVHGASVAFEKNGEFLGVVIIAPTGTGKTSQFHELLYNVKSAKAVGDDYLFVSFDEGNKKVIAEQPEKQLYMRTEIAEKHPTFITSFEGLPIENVVIEKDKCKQKSDDPSKTGPCYQNTFEKRRKCVFDEGVDRCYWSYSNSRVMFPRERFTMIIADEKGNVREIFKGKENVIDKMNLNFVLLLTRDEESPPIKKLEKEEAIRILKEGRFKVVPGAGPPEKWGQYGSEPFYDPYQLEMDMQRQEEFFRKLFDFGVKFYILNTGSYHGRKIEIHQTHSYIRAALKLN